MEIDLPPIPNSLDCANPKAQPPPPPSQEEDEDEDEEDVIRPSPSVESIKTPHVDEPPPPPPSLRRRRSSSSRSVPTAGSSVSQKRSERRAKFSNPLVSQTREDEEVAPRSTPMSELVSDNQQEASSSSALASDQTVTSRDETLDSPDGSLLFSIAGFVIKTILFQLNLLVTCFTFPVRLIYLSFLVVNDPFGTIRNSVGFAKGRFFWVWNGFLARFCPVAVDRKLMVRLALGCFWSAYVGFVLLGILITAFLGGNLLMKSIVEEPLKMVRELDFDYTKPSPDALVPIDSSGMGCNFDWNQEDAIGKQQLGARVVPANQNLKLVISLTMPESDYNRKLGMFQVRAEFLSANGQITYSSRKPCMMLFKSHHIRLLESLFKTGTLLAGYSSESQILRIKMTGFVEGNKPTVCVRVIIEQRAEYRHGAGIPEIYSASIEIQSQLPLLKSIIWSWRRTIFIWVGICLFFLELFFAFFCCRSVLIPRMRSSSETRRRP